MLKSHQEDIKKADIYEHPDNPRKNLGDLTELTESIRKNGIMQNMKDCESVQVIKEFIHLLEEEAVYAEQQEIEAFGKE